jgi:hypothetical protein
VAATILPIHCRSRSPISSIPSCVFRRKRTLISRVRKLALGELKRADSVAAAGAYVDRAGNDGGASVGVSRSAVADGAHGPSDRHRLSSPSEAG